MLSVLLMKRITTIRTALIAAAFFMPISAGLIYLGEAVAVDNCLDMGGSFNFENMTCDFDTSHPHVPFKIRHPNLIERSGVGFASFMLLFVGSMLAPRRGRLHNNKANRTSSVGPVS